MAVLDTFRLDNQVALVTGGSRGLGLQIAQALGEAGAAVAITARREEGLLQAVQQLEAREASRRCHPAVHDQVLRIGRWFGKVSPTRPKQHDSFLAASGAYGARC